MNFDTKELKDFKKVIEDIVDARLASHKNSEYLAAVVVAVHNDNTVDVTIPPDNARRVNKILNKSNATLNVGDSVELCMKNGKLSNAWVAVKHGKDVSGKPLETRVALVEGLTADNAVEIDTLTKYKKDLKYYEVIEPNSDLNDFVEPGTYRAPSYSNYTSTLANVPVGVSTGFTLYVMQYTSVYNNLAYRRQELIQRERSYVRYTNDGGTTWTEWMVNGSYRIGDIFVTSSKDIDPSTHLGGQWEMFEKALSSYSNRDDSLFVLDSDYATEPVCYYTRAYRTITLNLSFRAAADIDDNTITFGTIDLNAIGITQIPANMRVCGYSDGGEGILMAYMSTTGKIISIDVVGVTNNNIIKSGQLVYLSMTFTVPGSYCIADKCDKFYWRRTG